MTLVHSATLLRRALLLDALFCAGMGLLMVSFATLLAPILGLPSALLSSTGWLLLPIAACVGNLARREQLPSALVWAVIGLNSLWVLQSCGLLFTGWVAPSVSGYAFVLVQAAITAMLVELECRGLRASALTA
jgi:hypothetical protein